MSACSTAAAQLTAQFHGWAPIVGGQLEYSLLERTPEGELLPMAYDLGMGALAGGPLKSGWLSGKFSSATAGQRVDTARGDLVGAPSAADYAVIDTLNDVAAGLGTSAAEVELAWVRGSAGITSTLLGARTMRQLEANLALLSFELPADPRGVLDEASAPHLPFPIENTGNLAPTMRFNGATANGVAHVRFPMLEQSATRY